MTCPMIRPSSSATSESSGTNRSEARIASTIFASSCLPKATAVTAAMASRSPGSSARRVGSAIRPGYSPVVLAPERIIRLEADRVVLLDQRRLPDEEVELVCESAADVADAIRTLAVRGAPATGIAGAYGYALTAVRGEDLDGAFAVLERARPTAANLGWALREVRSAPDPAARARELHAEEVERCRQMSEHAAELLAPGCRALTHCNTGALATGGQGTALGALCEGWSRGLVRHVFVDETRPLLQGARLTAWELAAAGIPHTVVADAAAGSLLAAGGGDCVLVGADR